MKNQIIKKIMAYLLVGAMVVSTPITASANELENAYATEEGEDGNPINNSKTGTSTSTNTATQSVELPEEIAKNLPSIVGIALDKTSLEFDKNEDTSYLQARALFDTYDASKEEMQWVEAEAKQKVEAEINWFSDDYSVATIGHVWNVWNGEPETADGSKTKQGNKAEIKAVSEGVTTVCAWIEADGLVYTNAPQKPTPGDFVATATVVVKNEEVTVRFDDNAVNKIPVVYSKRQYNLKKYTYLNYGQNEVCADEDNVTALTYSITGTESATANGKTVKTTASITTDGVLKVTKGAEGGKIYILVVSENGEKDTGTIILGKENPVTGIEKMAAQKLDLGFTRKEDDEPDKIAATVTVNAPKYKTQTNKTEFGYLGTTDEFIWTSNKPAIADVALLENGNAEVTAKGVGTAKITVKASSGKSTSFNVTVYATPTTVELSTVPTTVEFPEEALKIYTGQTKALYAILKGDKGQELPVGTTTIKWAIDKVSGKNNKEVTNPYAKVSSKKDVATIKASDILKDPTTGQLPNDYEGEAKVRVTAVTYKNNTNNRATSLDLNVVGNKPTATVTIAQSSLKDVSLEVFKNPNSASSASTGIKTSESKKSATSKTDCYVGQKYLTLAKGTVDKGSMDSIAWTVSGKGVTYSTDRTELTTDFTSNAKTTIKASYITITDESKAKYKKTTQTINITPIQNAETIAFAKPEVVKNATGKDQSVTFKISQVSPKNAKYTIDASKGGWKVLAYNGTEEVTDAAKDLITKTTKNSVTIKIPQGYTVGSVIKVGAYTTSGAVAYGYIHVTEPTKAVTPYVFESADKENGEPAGTKTGKSNYNAIDLKIGENKWLSAKLTITGKSDLQDVGKESEFGTKGDTTSYETEPIVSYTLDKKGALCVKIDADGKITPLQAGKATVTIKTLSGKSAKATIIVSNPESAN